MHITGGGGGGGVTLDLLWIFSDLKFSIPEFFGEENLANIFCVA